MPERQEERPITVLLQRARAGEEVASDELYQHVYANLRDIAAALMRTERSDHTLQPTALVSEAWLRLGSADVEWRDRAHFYRVAARAMRRALVDHARARRTTKRDGGRARDPLDAVAEAWDEMDYDLLDLNDALDGLAREDEVLARLVELRFFAGLTLEETGRVLDMSYQKVHRGWVFARSWLHDRMAGGEPAG